MMSIFLVVLLAIVVLAWKPIIKGITIYKRIKNNFSKGNYDSTEKGTDKCGGIIEMEKKDGIWEISTNVKSM